MFGMTVLRSGVALVVLSGLMRFGIAVAQEAGETLLPRLRSDPAEIKIDPPLPRSRPDPTALQPDTSETESETAETEPPGSPRVYQAACPAVLTGSVIAETLPPIDDGVCGVASPLLVSDIALAGRVVALSAPTVMNCRMASQLAEWSARVDAYAQTVFKSGIETLLVGTGYMCRPRNNAPGSDYSEHGFANALDVTGFALDNGTRLSLPEDWGVGAEADAMRYAHAAACGLFTTVLGPKANALHTDHLHLDLGCHGQSCAYRLCE